MVGSARKIAVVGSGIAGITSAFLLDRHYDVTLFEAGDDIGGHTNTRVVTGPVDNGVAIDTGFIVCNPTNYPNFYRLLNKFGVALRDSEMSFGFYSEKNGFNYLGPALREFIRLPGNFFNANFLAMVGEQYRFNRRALHDLSRGELQTLTLGDYVRSLKCSPFFVEHYLTPLLASIWSSPDAALDDFPALTFVTFFKNHGMLELRKRPRWQTLVGGSHSYLHAFKRLFTGTIRTQARICGVRRYEDLVTLRHADGSSSDFDKVILATHADDTLSLLEDADAEERELLGSWRYSRNRAVLHFDASVMPPLRRAWASWNYRAKRDSVSASPVAISYYMNRLQGLVAQRDYFVTLNPGSEIDEGKVLYDTVYTHPVYSTASVASQQRLTARNGTRNTFYCGAYLRYGFHEDGVVSALNVVRHLGVDL